MLLIPQAEMLKYCPVMRIDENDLMIIYNMVDGI